MARRRQVSFLLPGFQDMTAYFNLDNGSGKIRGIYAEGNFAAVPVLRNWLAPFDSLGANKVVAEPTGSTDHVMMARLGLPAFQFIQDPLDYGSQVHHTNLDTFDHLRTEDLRQAAVILATVLLQAADSDQPQPATCCRLSQARPTRSFITIRRTTDAGGAPRMRGACSLSCAGTGPTDRANRRR